MFHVLKEHNILILARPLVWFYYKRRMINCSCILYIILSVHYMSHWQFYNISTNILHIPHLYFYWWNFGKSRLKRWYRLVSSLGLISCVWILSALSQSVLFQSVLANGSLCRLYVLRSIENNNKRKEYMNKSFVFK